MGGWHLAHRATKDSNYIGISSKIKLPFSCTCIDDSNLTTYDGVFPEFIHGFYASDNFHNYGIDIGIIYRKNKFRIFHHAAPNTCVNSDPTTIDDRILNDVHMGDIIELRTAISGKYITAKVLKNNTIIKTYKVELAEDEENDIHAMTRLNEGAKINREILMATNRTNNYLECGAKFHYVSMYDSTLTTTDYDFVILNKDNSEVSHYADEKFEFMINNFHYSGKDLLSGYKCMFFETSNDQNYVSDFAKCDFSK